MKTLLSKAIAPTALVMLLLTGCATNPVTGKRELNFVSENREIKLGEQHYMSGQQSQGGPYVVDPELTRYVSDIGMKIADASDRPQLPYEFVVLNNSVPNAWAMPGGKIAINRGLLTELDSEAELAAVLSHEVVHAAARHGAKSMQRGILFQVGLLGVAIAAEGHRDGNYALLGSQIAGGLINLKYGRNHESEADYYGMLYMSRTGYDVTAAVRLQETFFRLKDEKKSNAFATLLASHPPSEDRIEANRKTATELPQGGFVGEKEYAAKMARMTRGIPAYKKLDDGVTAMHQRRYPEALALSEQAIAIEPEEAMFYGLRGDALSAMKRSDEARSAYDKAIVLNPDYYYFKERRGMLALQAGNKQAARKDLQAASALLPTADALYSLGVMDLESGNRQQAIANFRAASGVNSATGQKAAAQLAHLTLASNPRRYVDLQVRTNRRGYATVIVKNNSPIAITGVRGRVYLKDPDTGRVLRSEALYTSGSIDPGQSRTFVSRFGPYRSTDIRRYVQAELTSARPAK